MVDKSKFEVRVCVVDMTFGGFEGGGRRDACGCIVVCDSRRLWVEALTIVVGLLWNCLKILKKRKKMWKRCFSGRYDVKLTFSR